MRMPTVAWVRSRRAAVISFGVKTTGVVIGGVQAAEYIGPDKDGAPAAEVASGMVVVSGGRVVVGRGVDMTDPETADTRLIGAGILPGLALRL